MIHVDDEMFQEMNTVFYAYLGGICLSSGLQAAIIWVDGLVDQELEALFKGLVFESETQETSPLPKRPKSTQIITPENVNNPYTFFASQPPPSPPPFRQPPPHRPMYDTLPPNPMAPAQPNLPFLPLFKQAALQRGVKVEYLAEFNVPSYAGKWMVKCIGK